VDASVVAPAERVSVRGIDTRDVRRFAAALLADGSSFEPVVRPT
jgi:hypothetical protein